MNEQICYPFIIVEIAILIFIKYCDYLFIENR